MSLSLTECEGAYFTLSVGQMFDMSECCRERGGYLHGQAGAGASREGRPSAPRGT